MPSPLTVSALALACALQAPADRFEARQVVEDLAALESAVRSDWSYFEARATSGDVDLDALLRRARSALDDGCTREEFAIALRELVAGLHDGHATIEVPGIQDDPPRRLPIELVECAEGIAVARCWAQPEGGESPEIPARGDLVRAIAGVPIEQALVRAEHGVFGSTPLMRRRLALEAVCRSETALVELQIETLDGTVRRLQLSTLANDVARSLTHGAPPSLSWPRVNTALLAIPSFALAEWKRWLAATQEERDTMLPAVQAQFDALLDEVIERKAEALIIDLRGNPGGTDSLGIHVAQRLLADPFVYFRLSSKLEGQWSEPSGLTYEPRRPFTGRVVLLIDERTFSTASNFARCLRDLHPALRVAGRPDGAGTGAPRRIAQLPHSLAEITLCTHRVRGPAGAITEGNPTQPDVLVTWSRNDLLSGRDPDLEAAWSLLD
jgi:hypothetical protein